MEDTREEQKKEIHWNAYEYIYRKKSVDWYWYFGLVVVILIASAFWLQNMLFAFIVAIGAFIMVLYANKHPRELEYVANKNSISFDDVSYPYNDILCFCIINDRKKAAEKILLLRLKKETSLLVNIPLGNADLDELRTFLLGFIEEKEIAIPFGYTFMDIIGF